jgi:hypothetical protein
MKDCKWLWGKRRQGSIYPQALGLVVFTSLARTSGRVYLAVLDLRYHETDISVNVRGDGGKYPKSKLEAISYEPFAVFRPKERNPE